MQEEITINNFDFSIDAAPVPKLQCRVAETDPCTTPEPAGTGKSPPRRGPSGPTPRFIEPRRRLQERAGHPWDGEARRHGPYSRARLARPAKPRGCCGANRGSAAGSARPVFAPVHRRSGLESSGILRVPGTRIAPPGSGGGVCRQCWVAAGIQAKRHPFPCGYQAVWPYSSSPGATPAVRAAHSGEALAATGRAGTAAAPARTPCAR